MVGETHGRRATGPLAVQSLTRKFSTSAITVCAHVMEKRVHTFKRTFSLRNIFNNNNNNNNYRSKREKHHGKLPLNHGFSFKRTPSRKLDIYFPYIRG